MNRTLLRRATLALSLVPCMAVAADSWPTAAEVFADRPVGAWAKYKAVQIQGGRSQETSAWQTYQGLTGGSHRLVNAAATQLLEVAAPPAEGLRSQVQSIAPGEAVLLPPTPPGAKVESETVKREPFRGLVVPAGRFDGEKVVHSRSLKLPNGMELSYRCSGWWSPEVPAAGLVKLVVAAQMGVMSQTSTLELETSSVQVAAQASAEAAEEAALRFEKPGDVLAFALRSGKQAWKLDEQLQSPLEDYQTKQEANYFALLWPKPWEGPKSREPWVPTPPAPDPSLTREAAAAELATRKKNLRPGVSEFQYSARRMAVLAARTGDEAAARGFLPERERGECLAQVPLVVALHTVGGKPARAEAWRKELGAGAPEYERAGCRSLVDSALAAAAQQRGDEAEAQRMRARAREVALEANRLRNAFQPVPGEKGYWPTLDMASFHDPYRPVVEQLAALETAPGDAALLAFLADLQDEMPETGAVRKAWEAGVEAADDREDPALLFRLLGALPRSWELNWATAVIRQALVPRPGDRPLAGIRALVKGFQSPAWRAEALRAAGIAKADAGDQEGAAALAEDLDQVVAAGAWNKHASFLAVARARAALRAGKREEALALFSARATDLRESVPLRGVNGASWMGYLYELGGELGAARPRPEEASAWCRVTKERPHEAAFLALGIGKGMVAGR